MHLCCHPLQLVSSLQLLTSATLQVANAKVLIPTTGQVTAEDIHAVKDLHLIVNPAAGKATCLQHQSADAQANLLHLLSIVCLCKYANRHAACRLQQHCH